MYYSQHDMLMHEQATGVQRQKDNVMKIEQTSLTTGLTMAKTSNTRTCTPWKRVKPLGAADDGYNDLSVHILHQARYGMVQEHQASPMRFRTVAVSDRVNPSE